MSMNACGWEPLETPEGTQRQPRQYQYEAVQAWIANKRRGLYVYPPVLARHLLQSCALKEPNDQHWWLLRR